MLVPAESADAFVVADELPLPDTFELWVKELLCLRRNRQIHGHNHTQHPKYFFHFLLPLLYFFFGNNPAGDANVRCGV